MRIEQRWMSFHFLDFHEKVQTSFEHDFLDAGNAFRLREEDGENGLEIGREAGEYVGLNPFYGFEVLRAPVYAKRVVSEILKPYANFLALSQKAPKVSDAGVSDIDELFGCECRKHDERT